MHQLTDEQLATIISWAKKTPDVQAVFLSGKRARGTAEPDSNVELALSITGQDPLRRLATFLSRRRAWRGELEAALGLAVQLERARADSLRLMNRSPRACNQRRDRD
jgi:predicted nucleotidyltransferase